MKPNPKTYNLLYTRPLIKKRALQHITWLIILITGVTTTMILLMFKTDRNAGFSYHIVSLPLFAAYSILSLGFFIIFLSYLFTTNVQKTSSNLMAVAYFALTILFIGTLLTFIFLARKFDFKEHISYTQALLPVTIAYVLFGLLAFFTIYKHTKNLLKKRPK